MAHFARNSFEEITLIDDVAPSRRNAFLSNAGNLHVGYGTTGHAHSAMIKNDSPLLDTVKMSIKYPDAFSLLFAPGLGNTFRALSVLKHLYNKEVVKHCAEVFYYLYKRSSEIIEEIIEQEKVLSKKGRIVLCRTKEYFAYIQKQLDLARENFIIEGEVLDNLKAIRKVFPAAPDDIVGGIYYKDDVSFHPPTFSQTWLSKLSQSVNIIDGKVNDVAVKNKQVQSVTITRSDNSKEVLEADKFVFCTGSNNHPIMNPYTIPGGGISIDVELEENAKVGEAHMYTPEKLVYIYPYAKDKLRLCTGLYMGKSKLSQVKVDKIYKYLKATFHEYYGETSNIKNIINSYVGARPISVDAMPISGKLPYLSNGYIVNGLGSYGYPALALVEATLFPQSDSPNPPQSLGERVDPNRFSPLWTAFAKKII